MHIENVVTAWVLSASDALSESAAAVGAGMRDLAALTLISTHPGCSIEWLRPRVALTQSGTVRLADRLAERGWVKRSRSGGRQVALSVTNDGLRVLREWNRARSDVIEDLTEHLSPRDQERLVKALTRALEGHRRRRLEADRACRACDWIACGDDCPVDASVASNI